MISSENGILSAGPFSSWLKNIRHAQETGIEVPCGDCRACCTSSLFIHIDKDETAAVRSIPKAILFPAPGSSGSKVMGYDSSGRCPMFDGRCTIYRSRPRTCRIFDCRILSATGLYDECDRPMIAAQAARWRFEFPAGQDEKEYRALRSAAAFISGHRSLFPAGFIPPNAIQTAVLAVSVYALFMDGADFPAEVLAGKIISSINGKNAGR